MMKNHSFSDITILTDARYVAPAERNDYIQNVLDEDRLLKEALERKNLKVNRINWDDSTYDWSATRYIIFRTTWDYFDRFPEFEKWLNSVHEKTILINAGISLSTGILINIISAICKMQE